jgi:hypothetical protein
MKTKKLTISFTILCVVLLPSASSFAYLYTDDFEAPTLNSFWTLDLNPGGGQVSLSSDYAHSGEQSVSENTNGCTGDQRWANMFHDFGQPVYGSAYIYLYDTGAGQWNSNYITFSVFNEGTGDSMGFSGQDWNGAWYYMGRSGMEGDGKTDVPRTLSWHQIRLDWDASGVKAFIDSLEVYSDSIPAAYDRIEVDTYGPNWRPGWVSYWDDFQVSYIPEPATICLLGLGALSLLHRKKK